MTDNLRGALLMMGSMFAFTVNDTYVKLIGDALPLFQIIALRGVAATVVLIVMARAMGALDLRMPRRDMGLIALRCLAEAGAAWFFLTALIAMPLANVSAILQATPLMVTLGAALVFREAVGWRRFSAIAVGFIGVLLIIRPGPEGFSLAAFYALASVFCVTVRDLATRRMSAKVPSLTITVLTSGAVTIFGLIGSAFVDWQPLDRQVSLYLVGSGIFVIGGYLLSVMVMRVGDVSFVAPFRYTSLIWALILGFFVFGHWPTTLTLVGAAIVVGTGLYTLFRERALRRSIARANVAPRV